MLLWLSCFLLHKALDCAVVVSSCRNETYCVLNNKASVRHHLSHHNVWTMMRLCVYRDFVGDHLHVLYINTSPFMPISQCSDMN